SAAQRMRREAPAGAKGLRKGPCRRPSTLVQAKVMAIAFSPDSMVVADRLVSLLGLRACRFEPFPFDDLLPRIEPGRIVLPAEEPALGPWTIGHGVELTVRCNDLPLGRFVLISSEPTVGLAFPPTAREAALMVADRFGADLGQTWMAEDARASAA